VSVSHGVSLDIEAECPLGLSMTVNWENLNHLILTYFSGTSKIGLKSTFTLYCKL